MIGIIVEDAGFEPRTISLTVFRATYKSPLLQHEPCTTFPPHATLRQYLQCIIDEKSENSMTTLSAH